MSIDTKLDAALSELRNAESRLELLGSRRDQRSEELRRELEQKVAAAQRRVNRLANETTVSCVRCGREIIASLAGEAQWRFAPGGDLFCRDCVAKHSGDRRLARRLQRSPSVAIGRLVGILRVLVVVMCGLFVAGSIATIVLIVRLHDQCTGPNPSCAESGGTFWIASVESVGLMLAAALVGYLTFRRIVRRRN